MTQPGRAELGSVRPDILSQMTFTLDIAISAPDVTKIRNAGQSVTLVRSVFGEVGLMSVEAKAIVAWLAFQPFQSNQVSWTGTGTVYGTASTLAPGDQILANAVCDQEAQAGFLYTLKDGTFSVTPHPGPYIYVENQNASPPFSFGLLQKATVNSPGTPAAVNALQVLFNEQAYFGISNDVKIFLASCAGGGTVLAQIPDNALTVQLTAQAPAANIGFNGSAFFLNP
jgi:hypothetical protein